MELSDFLLARIAEDEEAALAVMAPGERHPWGDRSLSEVPVERIPNEVCGYLGGTWGEHFARWDPARVLAECEAKRRIVAEHKTIRAAYPGTTIETDPCCATCSAGGEYPGEFPCPTMRLLALPYADHPDYRQEWRP